MISNFVGLAFIESPWFAQDRAANPNLADIVQDRADSQIGNPLFIESAVMASDHFGIPFDAVAMSCRVGILRFDRARMCSNRGNEYLAHFLFVPCIAGLDQFVKVCAFLFVRDEYFSAFGRPGQT